MSCFFYKIKKKIRLLIVITDYHQYKMYICIYKFDSGNDVIDTLFKEYIQFIQNINFK